MKSCFSLFDVVVDLEMYFYLHKISQEEHWDTKTLTCIVAS